MMEHRRSKKQEPDYYGSLERLPLAPVRGKPPPYASRRQQGSRRGNLKSNNGLSRSAGDLTTPNGRNKTNSNASIGGDREGWGGGDGGAGDLGIPLNPRDVSNTPVATPAHPHHQRHGSVFYGYSEHNDGGSGDVGLPLNHRDVSDALTNTSSPAPHHQGHGSVSYSYLEQTSGDSERRHTRNSDRNPSQECITPTATPTPQPRHQRHGSVFYSYLENTDEDSDQRHKSNHSTNSSNTAHLPSKTQEQRHSGREQSITQNKTQHEQKQGNRNMGNDSRTQQERLRAGAGETSDSDTASPASTLERKQRSGSISNTNSLKNYRELAAIPDHTFVKWGRSQSMNDISTREDDANDFNDKDGRNKDEMRRAASYSNTRDAVDKEGRDKREMRLRKSYPDAKNVADKEERNKGETRRAVKYNDTKDLVDKEGRKKHETRHTPQPLSVRSRSEDQVAKKVGDKDGKRSQQEPRPTAQSPSARSKSVNQVTKDAADRERRNHGEIRRTSRSPLERNKSGDGVDSVKEDKVTTQRDHRTVTVTFTSSPPPPSSDSHVYSSGKNNQEEDGGVNDVDGVFVATPIFLEGSPSSSPPPSQPLSSTVHQGSHVQGAKQDLLERERVSALSTLRREILHLTRLKEEIELNLIKSQTELKEEVAGLRKERGGLEAVMEQREKRLHAQEEEIKDLKDTITQLQTLVFASDGEARLQRQASDLQEQLREEKRHHLEETTQLRREVRALSSRLQEKEEQLEKYKSDPALSSWGSGGLEKATAGSWKTSLPDVRKEQAPNSLGSSMADRRRSFSSMSDCSDDSHFSTVGSLISRTSRVKDESGRLNGSAVRSYKAVQTLGKPNTAPEDDSRSHVVAMISRKFDKAPVVEARPRGASVRSNKTVESSGKSFVKPVNSRLNGAPTRLNTAAAPSGKIDKTPVGEGRLWGAPVRSDKAMEVSRKSNIGRINDPSSHSVPTRLDTPLEPRNAKRKPANQTEMDVDHIGSRKPLVPLEETSVATLDLAPGSVTVPLRDTRLSEPADTQRYETSDDSGRPRVKTVVYLELGDYTGSGGGDGGDRESEYVKSRGYDRETRDRNFVRSRGDGEEDYGRSGGYAGELRRTSYNPVTKSTVPPVPHHHTPSIGSSPHMPRPSTSPSPPPPQVARRVTTRHHSSSPSPQVTRSSAVSPQVTRAGQVTKQGSSQPSARIRSQDAHPEVRSSRDMETGLRTAWRYKPVDGSGGTPAEEVRRRDPEIQRGVKNGWRERELTRGWECGRMSNPEGRSGGREREISRGTEYGTTNNSEEQRRVEDWRKRDSELAGGNARVSNGGKSGRGTQATSYITATIQCLYSLPPLHRFFMEEFWGLSVKSEVAMAVGVLFRALANGTLDGGAMHHLREAVGRRDKIFLLHQDPAAADFLSCLLAWLHSDLTPQTHPQAPPASSVVSQLFHGLRESLIVCPTWGKVLSAAMESFNYLTLSVPGEGAWTLQELLARRFKPHEMAWDCQLCGHRHSCSHQPHLLQPPHILVLYLRRPSSGAASARVLFPEAGLVLHLHHQHQQHHQHQHPETRTLRSHEYQLVGVVSREVGEDSSVSHHSAFYRRLENGSWGMWKEDRVAAVSRREVLSQQAAHLLFYIQQEEESQQAPGFALPLRDER